jgi:hypothetical protein
MVTLKRYGRYRCARETGKTAILNEFCAVCGYHRKYALRLLCTSGKRSKPAVGKPGPASRYAVPELLEALRTIWMTSDQLCSKRLKAALPLWLPHYETSFKPLSAETRAKLDAISAASVPFLFAHVRLPLLFRDGSLGRGTDRRGDQHKGQPLAGPKRRPVRETRGSSQHGFHSIGPTVFGTT